MGRCVITSYSIHYTKLYEVVAKVQTLMGDGIDKIAIIFRGRGKNAEIVEAELTDKKVAYFYGMFTDEDAEYVESYNFV